MTAAELPLSVWVGGDRRDPSVSGRHRWPGIQAPIAQRTIEVYTSPGEIVVDPVRDDRVVERAATKLGRRAAIGANDVALLLTGPPLPRKLHSLARANRVLEQTVRGVTAALGSLRVGGYVAVLTRPIAVGAGDLFDMPGQLTTALRGAGLVPFDRNVVLRCRVENGELQFADRRGPSHDDLIVLRRTR